MKMTGQLHAPGDFTPEKIIAVPSTWKVVWPPEPLWTFWRREKSHSEVAGVAQLGDYATSWTMQFDSRQEQQFFS